VFLSNSTRKPRPLPGAQSGHPRRPGDHHALRRVHRGHRVQRHPRVPHHTTTSPSLPVRHSTGLDCLDCTVLYCYCMSVLSLFCTAAACTVLYCPESVVTWAAIWRLPWFMPGQAGAKSVPGQRQHSLSCSLRPAPPPSPPPSPPPPPAVASTSLPTATVTPLPPRCTASASSFNCTGFGAQKPPPVRPGRHPPPRGLPPQPQRRRVVRLRLLLGAPRPGPQHQHRRQSTSRPLKPPCPSPWRPTPTLGTTGSQTAGWPLSSTPLPVSAGPQSPAHHPTLPWPNPPMLPWPNPPCSPGPNPHAPLAQCPSLPWPLFPRSPALGRGRRRLPWPNPLCSPDQTPHALPTPVLIFSWPPPAMPSWPIHDPAGKETFLPHAPPTLDESGGRWEALRGSE